MSGAIFSKDTIVWTGTGKCPIEHIGLIRRGDNIKCPAQHAHIHALATTRSTSNIHFFRNGCVAHHGQIPRRFERNTLRRRRPINLDQDRIERPVGGCIEQPLNGTLVAIAPLQDRFYDLDAVSARDAIDGHGNLKVTILADENDGSFRRIAVLTSLGGGVGCHGRIGVHGLLLSPNGGDKATSRRYHRSRSGRSLRLCRQSSTVGELSSVAGNLTNHRGQIELTGDAFAPNVDLGKAGGRIDVDAELTLLLGMEAFERGKMRVVDSANSERQFGGGGMTGSTIGTATPSSFTSTIHGKIGNRRGGTNDEGIAIVKPGHGFSRLGPSPGRQPLNARVAKGHGNELASLLIPGPLLVLLAPGLFDRLELLHESSGRLLVVVHYEAVGQIEEVAGVALDDAAHLVGAEGGNGRSRLALATVLPPRSEGGKAELDGVLIGVGSEPWT
mmetsp:Transcript_33530/g.73550  ORF Transcript_33530/g.73550 Transcript_33530/m.73550 type:complete len:444 (+) Transcript_33530:694-2025(+)